MTRKRVLQFDPVPMTDADPDERMAQPDAPLNSPEQCPAPAPSREWSRLRRCEKCGKRHVAASAPKRETA
jgi:hypothetical protein